MKRITSIEEQKKRGSNRLNVFLEGRYAFSLVEDLAVTLKVGHYLSEAEIAELQRQDDIHKVYEAALVFLSYRPRSRQEIRMRLGRKGFGPEMIEQVLEKLEQQKIVGDEQFAQFWVENRQAHNPRGSRLLRQELRLKGVTRETIDDALPEAEDEDSAALRVARAKVSSLKGLEWRDFRRRLGDHLVRRGFGFSTAAEVVRRVWAEENGTQEDETDEIEALQDAENPRDST